MKRILSLLLILSLFLCLSLISCDNQIDDPRIDDEEEETELSAEDKALLDDIIFLLNDDTYDSSEFIGKFFGDFYIDSFDSGNDQDNNLSKIYKIGDVLAVESKLSPETNYQIVVNSKLCTVNRTHDGAKLHLSNTEDYPYNYPLSIFTAFGIDMSSVYSTEESKIEEPEATYDSFIISDDKKSVQFSQSYLRSLAKYLCSSMEMSSEEMTDFLERAMMDSSFDVEKQKFSIVIESTIESVGDIKIETDATFEDKKPASMRTCITMNAVSDGVPVTTTQEQIMRNMKYENDELVSLTIENRSITNTEYTQNGVAVKYFTSVIGVYDFITEGGKPSSVSIMVNSDQNISYPGQSQETHASLNFLVKDGNLTYDLSSAGLQQSYLAAEGVTLTTPENVTIPEDIYTVLPK